MPSAFDYFNLGDHVGDCSKSVAANRQHLLEYLPKTTNIQWLEQVHGNNVVIVTDHNDKPIIADAAITRSRDIALAVMTADCLPILLSNQDGSEIAAIHGGWRPLAADIIANTITKMHSKPSDIVAWLGPCIGVAVFEVGLEVKLAFCEISPQFQQAFTAVMPESECNESGKFFADLPLIAKLQLNAAGVTEIANIDECTYANTQKYYSYRRDGKTGRMASIISIR
ncbi:MAG: peptidoglycan editing factor PgeF [Cognaticolwellia sp.]